MYLNLSFHSSAKYSEACLILSSICHFKQTDIYFDEYEKNCFNQGPPPNDKTKVNSASQQTSPAIISMASALLLNNESNTIPGDVKKSMREKGGVFTPAETTRLNHEPKYFFAMVRLPFIPELMHLRAAYEVLLTYLETDYEEK